MSGKSRAVIKSQNPRHQSILIIITSSINRIEKIEQTSAHAWRERHNCCKSSSHHNFLPSTHPEFQVQFLASKLWFINCETRNGSQLQCRHLSRSLHCSTCDLQVRFDFHETFPALNLRSNISENCQLSRCAFTLRVSSQTSCSQSQVCSRNTGENGTNCGPLPWREPPPPRCKVKVG